MKHLLLWCSLFSLPTAWSQVFHFEDTSTIIIKNTSQSPAHWYLEIHNDCGVDTTLRWVTDFENIPAQWNINFDVQNQNWPTVNDGDSADFTAFVAQDFPQKLIIGAALNNTPGHGSVFFNIFDPANRTALQTIEYEYIVSGVGLEELHDLDFAQYDNGILTITNGKPTNVTLYDLLGKTIFNETNSESFNFTLLPKNEALLVHLTQGNKHITLKLLQE